MAENEGAGAAETQEQQQPRMNILTQFVRDLSFENVLAQRGTGGDVEPEINITINLEPRKRQPEHQYEVAAKVNIASVNKKDDQPLFVIELEYAGVFHIEGVPKEQLHPFLMIECPRMLFPFIRRIVGDVTRDGGFPPLNMEMIDFVALYRNTMAQRAAEAQNAEGENAQA